MKKTVLLLTLLPLFSCSNTKTLSTPETKITSNDQNELTIKLASLNSNYTVNNIDPIKVFNELDNGYKIEIIDYSSYYDSVDNNYGEAYNDPDNKICQDIMNGDIDILPDFIGKKKYMSLANKGAFVDLNDYLKTDPDVNFSTLNDHVLDLCSSNGHLYFLPLSFSVSTLCGYEKNVGNNENWTIDDMISLWNKMPEDSAFTMSETKDDVYNSLIQSNIGSYINYDNCTCSFTSDKFIKLLDFIDSFEEPLSYKEDFASAEAFIHPITIKGFQNFHELLWNEQNAKLSFVGFPSQDGSNSAIYIDNGMNLAINALASEEVRKGAWEFLSFLESYDYQYELISGNISTDDEGNEFDGLGQECCFPMNKNAFEKKKNEFLEKSGQSNKMSVNGQQYDIGYINQEEYTKLIDLINGTTYINFDVDQNINMIISEEIQNMFNGDQTPTQTAEAIQNRVVLVINE